VAPQAQPPANDPALIETPARVEPAARRCRPRSIKRVPSMEPALRRYPATPTMPSTLPTPPDEDRLTWRPATFDDAARLAELVTAVHAVENLEDVPGPDGFRHLLSGSIPDSQRDTLLAVDESGRALALAFAWPQAKSGRGRAFLWLEAHPTRIDLEPFLLSWMEARGAEFFAERHVASAHLRCHIEDHRRRVRRLLEKSGYRHARDFVQMHRRIEGVPSSVTLPDGVDIVPWSEDLDDQARLACNAAFQLHWDTMPLDPAQWRGRVSRAPFFRSDLSFLAVHDGRVLSLAMSSVDLERAEREGTTEVWIDRLATLPDWHRRGLGTALLKKVIRAAADCGFDTAALTVDAESNTNATALYGRLGFVTRRANAIYVKEV